MGTIKYVAIAVLLVACLAGAARADGVPERVVSINLCTDQLALLIAAPGQLVSVSYLASNEASSLMVAEARKVGVNRGLAEEVFRLDPDLVLAGTYTSRATVNLLERLGRRVVTFAPARNFADIRANIRRVGELLGRRQRAEDLVGAFDRTLERIVAQRSQTPARSRKVLGSYGANTYTTGGDTLESEIVKAAGFRHLGEELGLSGTSKLPLESLILADPDYVMSWRRWSAGPARATEVLRHPALKAWFDGQRRLFSDFRYWICGTPFTLRAVEALHRQTAVEEGLP